MTEEERWASCLGVVRIGVLVDVLAVKAVTALSLGDVFVTFVDITDGQPQPDSNVTLCAVDATTGALLTQYSFDSAQPHAVKTVSMQLSIVNRTWQAVFYATQHFYSSRRSFEPYTVLIVLVLLIVSACAGGCVALVTQCGRVCRLQAIVLVRVDRVVRTRSADWSCHGCHCRVEAWSCLLLLAACTTLASGYLALMKWIATKAKANRDKHRAAAEAAAVVALTARQTHEKTLRYGG